MKKKRKRKKNNPWAFEFLVLVLFLKPQLTADIVPFTWMQQEILRIF